MFSLVTKSKQIKNWLHYIIISVLVYLNYIVNKYYCILCTIWKFS